MKRWQKILLALTLLLLVLVFGLIVAYRANNQPPQLAKPNYFEYYKNQDTVPEGEVAIFVSHLVMPETVRMPEFVNMATKPLQYVPWPFRMLAASDPGTVLLDPNIPYEFDEFVPTELVDPFGQASGVDGIAYMDKYHAGELEWVPPSERLHLDHGYFLDKSQDGGMPAVAAKLGAKATTYYYGMGNVGGKLPHEAGSKVIVDDAMARVEADHGELPWRWITAENFPTARQYVYELLDGGADTLILAAPVPIYSHHEDFNSSIKHAMHYVEEWETENGKEIKVIIAPQFGDFDVLRDAYLNMLRDRLDTLPSGSDVKLVVSVHGMPWDAVPHEAWIELAPTYRDGMVRDAEVIVEEYDFGRTEVVLAQDHFADPINNPNGTYLATGTAFWDGIDADYDTVINLPIEFFVENTDTMFAHAMYNFEEFPEYDRYDPIDYQDWSVPYTREFVVNDTTIIYNGLPVGEYNKPIVEAFYQSIDSVLSQGNEQLEMD